MPDAGGLVIASDQKAARAYAKLLRDGHRREGRRGAVRRRGRLRADRRVRRVATSAGWSRCGWCREGVDIPRLAVGVYATSGLDAAVLRPGDRPVRPGPAARGRPRRCSCPACRTLLGLASEMEAAARPRPRAAPVDRTRTAARRRAAGPRPSAPRTARRADKQFEALSATAELDQVIFDGASFGTGATPGTPEEEEYLGLPGLLTPDQVATLLQAPAGRAGRAAAEGAGGR